MLLPGSSILQCMSIVFLTIISSSSATEAECHKDVDQFREDLVRLRSEGLQELDEKYPFARIWMQDWQQITEVLYRCKGI